MPELTRNQRLWTLFRSNFIISACTFGGGGVIIPIFQKKYVDDLHWISEDEMMEPPVSRYSRGIRISVWNEGKGISEEDLPYIWEKFYKAQTLTGQKGTGLGLSISRSILQMHGYAFGAKNIDGGVVFWFEASGRFER